MSYTNYYNMTHHACASLLLERDRRIAELEEIIERMCHADAIVITANEERLEAENAEVKCEWIKALRKNNDLITRILAVATERIGLDARDVLEEELRHAGLLGGGEK